MPKHRVASNVRCPFYKCEEQQRIYCEGLAKDMATHQTFAYPILTDYWRETYCKGDYQKCGHAWMLERWKYGKEGDQ